jgi:hypothetical protein
LYQASETLFDVQDFSLTGDGYAMKFVGTAQADADAKSAYIVNGKVTAVGLQAMQAKLLTTPKKTDAEKQAAVKAGVFIVMMQTYMEKGQGDVNTLTVSLDKNGTLLVNGIDRTKDLGAMFQNMAGKSAATVPGSAGMPPPAAPIVTP